MQTKSYCLGSEDIRGRIPYVKYAQQQAGMKAKNKQTKKSNQLND